MSWKDLLDEKQTTTLPWFGFTTIHNAERSWSVRCCGPRQFPPEEGWYEWKTTSGRWAYLEDDTLVDPDPSYDAGQITLHGYIVGDRFIKDNARVDPDPDKLIEQTARAYCVEPGLDRFTRATVVQDRIGHLVYIRQEFPLGPEAGALMAFQDRQTDLSKVPGVTPALDLAFQWISRQRELMEKRRQELERLRIAEEKRRAEEERIQQAMKDAGTAIGRRVLAARDFDTAAREALRVSGAELLDTRDSYQRNEKVVQYRFRERRLECVVDRLTLRIIDSGICLTDHHTGVKGDSWLTLESLPGTVGQAINEGKLVVYRHVEDEY